MITVVGGVYHERCITPEWHQLYGSGGRAAAALASFTHVQFHTYISRTDLRSLRALASATGFELTAAHTPETVGFLYFHPLSVPVITPVNLPSQPALAVEAETVLRFGMLEGDAVVRGNKVIFDPQSANAPRSFRGNGSTADTLAIVLNRRELELLTGDPNPETAAVSLLLAERADVVVVKRGSLGALVIELNGPITQVPAYQADFVFSIGSGDIFAAAFAAYWGLDGLSATVAADLSSRVVARYCESRSAAIVPAEDVRSWPISPAKFRPGKVYLAGPFFSMGERRLVEEARAALLGIGMEVFSPLHDVGTGPAEEVAPKDLAGLDQCDRMLALADGADTGTIFEIGYARAKGIPVIVFATTLGPEPLKMIIGSDCVVVDDFCTAIYRTGWSA